MSFLKDFIEIIKEYNIPVILVLTQYHNTEIKDQMISEIQNEHKAISYYQSILKEDLIENPSSHTIIESYGIDDLLTITNQALNNSFIFDNLENKINKNYDKTLNNLYKINIAVIGKSGIGISTLINHFFKGHVTAT